MRLDMTAVLKDLTGELLEQMRSVDNPDYISSADTPDEKPKCQRLVPITLRDICVSALTQSTQTDKNISGADKLKWFGLALKIQQEDRPDLTVEEITLLKERIGLICTVLIVGRAYELLDPVADEKPKKEPEPDGTD